MKETYFRVFGIISLIIVALIIINFKFFNKTDDRFRKWAWNLSYKGKILNKYIDKNNHNNKTILLDDGNKLILNYASINTNIYDSLVMGDFILKGKESLEGYVIRDLDTIYIIDYNWID